LLGPLLVVMFCREAALRHLISSDLMAILWPANNRDTETSGNHPSFFSLNFFMERLYDQTDS